MPARSRRFELQVQCDIELMSSGLLLLFLIIDAPGLESSFTSLYRTITSVEKDLDKEAKALRYLSIAIKRS